MALVRTLGRPVGPPSSRLSLLRPRHSARSFSLAAVWSSGTTNAAGYVALVPASLMDSLHWAGLPWYATLPLSAVLIRSLFVYPAMLRPMRKKLVRRANIQPLIDAHMSDVRRTMSRSKTRYSPQSLRVRLLLQRYSYRASLESSLFDKFIPTFPRLASFVTLITVSDAVRRLCGAKEGLLHILLGPFDWIANVLGGLFAPAKEVVEAYSETSSNPAHVEASDVAPVLPTESPWFEPSLMTEGLPWCTDLTAADPTFILPAMFSGAFFASIYFAPRVYGVAGQVADGPPRATNMQRIGMTIATLSFIPALQMPCALLLYFITNISVNVLQARWLAYTMPIRQAPTACRRPIRTQPLKEMKETRLPQPKRS